MVRSVDQIRRRPRRRDPRVRLNLAAWAAIFSKIQATVTDVGGVMSHAAIVAREYGLPAVVGTGRATAAIRTGQMIRVDGSEGTVTGCCADRATPGRCSDSPGATSRSSAARAPTSESCWRPRSRCRPALPSRPRPSRVRPRRRAARQDLRARWRDVVARRSRHDRAGVPCHQRGDAIRAGAEALREEVAAQYASWLGEDSRRLPSARAPSARTARKLPSRASRRTYLWVRGAEHVCDAVRDCWVSLYSPPAISYRARLGASGEPPQWGSPCS